MYIAEDIKYVGVNDHEIDLFEGQYVVPEGMAYNSYVILDEKTAVFDTVGENFVEEWLGKVNNALGEKKADYLIIQHMEPDHSSGIESFMLAHPETTIVATAKAFVMMQQFFASDFTDRRIVAAEGMELALGKHTLKFIMAPMVHWPEVMMTYDSAAKAVFSADAFGKFGALDSEDEEWDCEARRYYVGIVGKYGLQVQGVMKKFSALEVETICPLHGPVLNGDLSHYIKLYNTWSSYGIESEGILIAYTSVYGHTEKACEKLAEILLNNGAEKVMLCDLARADMAEAVEDAFRYGKIVLATTTYNNEIFPFMKQFIDHLTERNFQNRFVAFIENGTWAPTAAKNMKAMLEKCKNLTFAETTVTIKSALTTENILQLNKLAAELAD